MTGSGLARLLDLRLHGIDAFVGEHPCELMAGRRVFGGALLAMAARAATLTVPAGRQPHAMHHVFAGPVRTGAPIGLSVTRRR
jgi:acyl-CoA thioesterase-2